MSTLSNVKIFCIYPHFYLQAHLELFINVFKLHPYICNVKYLFLILPLFIWSCKEQVTKDEPTNTVQEPATKGKQSLTTYADRMVRAKLGIQANEKF